VWTIEGDLSPRSVFHRLASASHTNCLSDFSYDFYIFLNIEEVLTVTGRIGSR
jgi:hypothetical protein